MLERSRKLEVLGEVILPVHAEHCFPLLSIIALALQRHVDCGTCVDDALVENGHLAGAVIHAIVGTFGQLHATGSDNDGTLRYVIRAERDDVGLCAAELSLQQILVFLCNLLGNGLCGVVEFGESIFRGCGGRDTFADKIVIEITAERLCGREEDTAVADGVALDKVEIAVGVSLVVIVKAVSTEYLDERLALHLRLWDIGEIDTGGVALVLYVKAELVFLYRGSQVVDVFHHQRPVALRGIVAGVLERFDEESLGGISNIAGKLTDLIGSSTIGVLVGDGEHLVGLQGCLQRDVAHCIVDGVFRRREQTCTL